jgi:hypothetical protein
VTIDNESVKDKVETFEELSLYLFDLANTIHEHRDMLFRLSEMAKAQADKLRAQSAGATG